MLEDVDAKCQRDNPISRIKTLAARLRAGLPQQPEDFLRTLGMLLAAPPRCGDDFEWSDFAGYSHRLTEDPIGSAQVS